jgi:hypothetical protein
MGRRLDEAVWNERRELLERQATSGVSVARFCQANGIKVWNFNAWKQRLNGGASANWRMRSADRATAVDRRPSSFVQVPLKLEPGTNGGNSWVEVSSATGIVVRVPSDNLSALKWVLGNLAQENAND